MIEMDMRGLEESPRLIAYFVYPMITRLSLPDSNQGKTWTDPLPFLLGSIDIGEAGAMVYDE